MTVSWEVSVPRLDDAAVAARATTARLGDNPDVAARLASGASQGSGAPPGTGTENWQYYDYTNNRLYRSDGVGWIIMSEPWQNSTTLCITGVSLDGGLTSSTRYHRHDGNVDVVSVTTFSSGPSTISGMAWVPPVTLSNIQYGELAVVLFNHLVGPYPSIIEGIAGSYVISTASASGATVVPGSVTTSAPFAFANTDKIIVSGKALQMNTRYL